MMTRIFDGQDGLREAIIDFLLREPSGPEGQAMAEHRALIDPSTSPDDKIRAVVRDNTWTLNGHQRIVARIAIWSAGGHRRDVRNALGVAYRRRTDDLLRVLAAVRESMSAAGYELREGLSLHDVAALWIALDDGFAIRQRVEPGLVPATLVEDAFRALVEATVTPPGGPPRVGEIMSAVGPAAWGDRRRRAGRPVGG